MRCTFTFAFLVGAALAQQLPREPELPAFHAQSDLVILPFQVSRNKQFATDLTPADIALFEDGVPRKFTAFEGPQDHLPVELVLLFDVTTWPMGAGWNLQTLYGFSARWTESNASALLASGVQEVRAAVYHIDGVRLERLCQPTADPNQLLAAFRRLLDPIRAVNLRPSQRMQISVAMDAASDTAVSRTALETRFLTADRTLPSGVPVPLDLPPGSSILPAAGWPGTGYRGWPLEAAIGALKDVASGSDRAQRALVEFSEGRGGTTTSAEDVADHALTLVVAIYPVLLNYRSEGRSSPQPTTFGGRRGDEAAEPEAGRGSRTQFNSTVDNFARLGSLTGGRSFTPGELNAAAVAQILQAVRKEALDRAACCEIYR